MKLSFPLLIVVLILLELFVLRFKSALTYKSILLSSSDAVLSLKKDPDFYNNSYQVLDFGYFRAFSYSKEVFRAGDILKINFAPARCDKQTCSLLYRKAISLEKIGTTKSAVIMRLFLNVRNRINELYAKNLPSPYAELLAGMTLGIKNLPQNFSEALIKTGVIHVVVVSGFNVSLVISALFPLLLFFGRRVSLAISFLGVLSFVCLVGFEPPVIRAGIMGLIMLYGKYRGREKNVLAILFLAGAVMVFINPLIVYDLSFILSFLATFGLIAFSPILKTYLPFKFYGLEEDFIATLCAQILVWPIISYSFGRVSLISPLVNVLILWVVPLVTVMGFLYIAIASILIFINGSFLLAVVSWAIKIPLAYFSQVVDLFAKLSFSQIEFKVNNAFMVGYYLLLALVLLWLTKKKEVTF
ncbi:hypothetical protein COT69_00280 [candidate division WWE3 bacterium CG09_land_8_20_14_0_10_39_24]|uniref:ComEC/Rec2-related protein domain-containing protein n=2 Tax=Katanobacteria TaxID=422282 RepID=A0A2G9XC85_UNCKA|nr:MAG: hypothetical protein AUJ94_01955 [bacterium CG2_30_40_12]OJI09650.1 MAG: hypothetical protein BK003_00270 [bacterium CG09_39_24]PIP04574.1 MAG: hypothetical protein COX53_01760 [candidate division WWE3 bacterium CG23_combo_of_CG06-09_8_20_14_all_40_14]PIS13143.1 MAG: hypothetical protein COT69_00280 [candidate division WWE3 bacterium CG09_land_8_20_14_0_10_39_24]